MIKEQTTEDAMRRPFETLYQKYDAWYDGEPGRSLFAIESLALRESFLFRPSMGLEIGVGSGRFAEALGVRYGLDPAVNPLKVARRRGVKCVLGDGASLPFLSGVFDTCLLIVTLCFARGPHAILRETFRVLRPGGQVLLGMVLKESPWGVAYQALASEGHPFYSLARFYEREEVVSGLEGAGFSSIEIYSTLFQPYGKPSYDLEAPVAGYHRDAGFTVFRAVRPGK